MLIVCYQIWYCVNGAMQENEEGNLVVVMCVCVLVRGSREKQAESTREETGLHFDFLMPMLGLA